MTNRLKPVETTIAESRSNGSMKKYRIAAIVGGCALVGLGGILAITNPGPVAYEAFATQAAIEYVKESVCIKAPTLFGLQAQCQSALESNRGAIKKIIVDGTRRQNYVLFSLYTTDLAISSELPAYHVESVGILGRFVIYKTQKQSGGEDASQ